MRGKTTFHIRWKLFFYDVIVFAVTSVFLLVLYEGPVKLTQRGELQQMLLAFVCVFACRLVGKIYGQIWRYGGIQCYMRLVCTDCVAFLIYVILESVLPVAHISFPRLLVLSTVNTMGALIMRMSYRYAYKCSNLETFSGKILAALLKIFAGIEVGETRDDQKIKVAIIGAGNVGVTLAGELLANKMASYVPKCFVDIDKSKGGREIQGLPVLSENEATFQKLKKYGIQEIKGKQYIYEMSLEDHYLHSVCHLAEHFVRGGIGIRMVLDIYILSETPRMDKAYVQRQLKALKLQKFEENIRSLAQLWFSDDEKTVRTEVSDELENYALSGGIFGSRETARRNGTVLYESKNKFVKQLVFPSYEVMKTSCPWLKTPILLPAAWLVRYKRALTASRGNIGYHIERAKTFDRVEDQEQKERCQFFERCGLEDVSENF